MCHLWKNIQKIAFEADIRWTRLLAEYITMIEQISKSNINNICFRQGCYLSFILVRLSGIELAMHYIYRRIDKGEYS